MRPPLDIISNKLLEFFNKCTGIGRLKTYFNCLRIASASSDKPVNAITSADNTKSAMRRVLKDFLDIEKDRGVRESELILGFTLRVYHGYLHYTSTSLKRP